MKTFNKKTLNNYLHKAISGRDNYEVCRLTKAVAMAKGLDANFKNWWIIQTDSTQTPVQYLGKNAADAFTGLEKWCEAMEDTCTNGYRGLWHDATDVIANQRTTIDELQEENSRLNSEILRLRLENANLRQEETKKGHKSVMFQGSQTIEGEYVIEDEREMAPPRLSTPILLLTLLTNTVGGLQRILPVPVILNFEKQQVEHETFIALPQEELNTSTETIICAHCGSNATTKCRCPDNWVLNEKDFSWYTLERFQAAFPVLSDTEPALPVKPQVQSFDEEALELHQQLQTEEREIARLEEQLLNAKKKAEKTRARLEERIGNNREIVILLWEVCSEACPEKRIRANY